MTCLVYMLKVNDTSWHTSFQDGGRASVTQKIKTGYWPQASVEILYGLNSFLKVKRSDQEPQSKIEMDSPIYPMWKSHKADCAVS